MSWAEYLLAVIRRVAVGLEERERKFTDEAGGELRIIRPACDPIQECPVTGFPGAEPAEPEGLVFPPQGEPPEELVPADTIHFTGFLDGQIVDEVAGQGVDDEKDAVTGIGDDDIREDGVGVSTAGAPDTHDVYFFPDDSAVPEFSDAAFIITMDPAVPACAAVRAGIQFGAVFIHIRLE